MDIENKNRVSVEDNTACKVEVFDAAGKKVAEAAGISGEINLDTGR